MTARQKIFSSCFAILVVAACGGTSSGNTTNPDTASQPVTLGSSASVVALPAVGNFTESLTLPAGTPVGAALATTVTITAPSGLPTLAELPAPTDLTLSAPGADATTPPTPIAFLQLTNATSTAEVFGTYPGFSISTTGTATFPSGTYEAEVYDSSKPATGWVVTGTAVLVTPTLTFTGPQSTFTVAPGATVTLALVAAQPAGASGVVTLSPATTSAAPATVVKGSTASLTAVEASYTGAFTAVSNNTAVATVTNAGSPFTVTAVSAGSAQITVSDNAGHSATYFITVTATNAVGTFTINLPAQQGQAVAIPSISGSNVTSGTVTFATAQSGNPYPAGTVVTVTVSNAIPAGFGFSTSGSQQQVFGITFNSNNTITPAMMPALPAMTATISATNNTGGQLDGEVLLPLKAFDTSCSISSTSATAYSIGAQSEPQGLSAGVASGYDFFFGNAICLP